MESKLIIVANDITWKLQMLNEFSTDFQIMRQNLPIGLGTSGKKYILSTEFTESSILRSLLFFSIATVVSTITKGP